MYGLEYHNDNIRVTINDVTQYYKELCAHDWMYDMSDVHSTYERGYKSNQSLLTTAHKHDVFTDMYRDMRNYYNAKINGVDLDMPSLDMYTEELLEGVL